MSARPILGMGFNATAARSGTCPAVAKETASVGTNSKVSA